MKRRFGLRSQFILLIIIGLSVVFAVITVLVTRQTTKNLRASLVTESKSFAALATKPIGDTFGTYQDSGRIKIIQQTERFTDLDKNISNVAVVGLDGEVLYQQKEGQDMRTTAARAASFDPVYVMSKDRLTRIITPYIEDFGAHRYSIVYDVSDQAIEHSIQQLRMGIIALAFAALLV